MKRDLINVIGVIYKVTSPNGEIYIGQTINKKLRKYHYNCNGFKKQIKLWNNCQKYNWNPVSTFEVIEECLCGFNKENINQREKYWIVFYDSFRNGLNANEGGCGNIGYKASDETRQKLKMAWKSRPKCSDETKLKMSLSAKVKPAMTRETKQLMSKLNSGENNPMFNKHHPDDVRARMSKGVCEIDNDGNIKHCWASITNCAKELNITISGISKVLKGELNKTKGRKFIYNK